jgi:hypothetical protein
VTSANSSDSSELHRVRLAVASAFAPVSRVSQ